MRTLILFSVASIFLFSHCNKSSPPPLPMYTVKGKFINGTTGQVLYIGQPAQLEVRTSPLHGNVQSAILASCTIDTGGYNFTYTQTNITDKGAYLRVDLPLFNAFGSLPVNQNVNQNIYISSMGTVKIKVQTQKPLELNKDTLYIAYFQNGSKVCDTITKTINGTLVSFRPPPSTNIIWGRGYKIFEENLNGTYEFNFIQLNITGDPIVDSTTINY